MANLNLNSVYLFSSEEDSSEERLFRRLKPKVVRTPNQLEKALLSSAPKTLWISFHTNTFAKFLSDIARNQESFRKITQRTTKPPIFLSLEHLRGALDVLLKAFFSQVVVAGNRSFLPSEQLAEVLSSSNASDLVIGGQVDTTINVLTLFKGDLSLLVVPHSAFKETAAGVKPDFSDFEIIDHGQTIRLGKYEAAVDALLYEFDSEFRKHQKSQLAAAEKSFGASLRRLRLQKGLNQTDFPGITEKEIGRIERGEVKRPHTRTIGKLAKLLNVKPDEIETY